MELKGSESKNKPFYEPIMMVDKNAGDKSVISDVLCLGNDSNPWLVFSQYLDEFIKIPVKCCRLHEVAMIMVHYSIMADSYRIYGDFCSGLSNVEMEREVFACKHEAVRYMKRLLDEATHNLREIPNGESKILISNRLFKEYRLLGEVPPDYLSSLDDQY